MSLKKILYVSLKKKNLFFTNSLSNFHAIVIFVLPDVGIKFSGIFRHGTSGENKRIVGTTFQVYY